MAANARRLHLDAHYLLADDRYRSAFALTILAIEEVGKIIQIILDQMLNGRLEGSSEAKRRQEKAKKNWHKKKQEYVSLLIMMAAMIGVRGGKLKLSNKGQLVADDNGKVKVIYDPAKGKICGAKSNEKLTMEQIKQQLKQFVENSPEDDLIASHELETLLHIVQPLRRGDYNDMKNSAFYEEFANNRQDDFQKLAPTLMSSADIIFDVLKDLSP